MTGKEILDTIRKGSRVQGTGFREKKSVLNVIVSRAKQSQEVLETVSRALSKIASGLCPSQ